MTRIAEHPATREATFILLDLLQQRKTRRFGRGMTLSGGPLQSSMPQSAGRAATWATCTSSGVLAWVTGTATPS